eukprot:1421496-Prymnesium_polylepis.1
MSLWTHDPFRPLTHVRSALQVSEHRNELHGVRRPPRTEGRRKKGGLQTMLEPMVGHSQFIIQP